MLMLSPSNCNCYTNLTKVGLPFLAVILNLGQGLYHRKLAFLTVEKNSSNSYSLNAITIHISVIYILKKVTIAKLKWLSLDLKKVPVLRLLDSK